LGVRNGYLDYRQMGVDRWLAILASYVTYRSAACVVDAGTALTIDAVAADGSHRGGLIVPGPALMRRSLLQDTAGIRPAADRLVDTTSRPAAAWGRDTDSCIRLGALRATACLIEDRVKAWRDLEAPGAVLVLTGGDAAALGDALSLPVEHRPHLVLEGLALRYGGD
jgi:type III pantothenate kinase